eukprot:3233310-Pyramimonas_sp.AAC.1
MPRRRRRRRGRASYNRWRGESSIVNRTIANTLRTEGVKMGFATQYGLLTIQRSGISDASRWTAALRLLVFWSLHLSVTSPFGHSATDSLEMRA